MVALGIPAVVRSPAKAIRPFLPGQAATAGSTGGRPSRISLPVRMSNAATRPAPPDR
ncbi:MAG: hypothetical protein AVDCRST_MAG59-4509 [uncultured Thermomicrobiales bacterium]|uniref:Uncharacterized protein n=1 Tax=uncultured Thermomicrobiales bacterium TaxID=1645740 RepID=A0A6J4VPS4_9BACT|nr:MAG: hypothetical protein AVDCRST_MAG59-4509 [uncultured Thermomicrobiales bacterium]